MHIHIITAIWQRPRVTRLFMDHFAWLRDRLWADERLTMAVAGSEGAASRRMCEDDDIYYVETPNKPLGAKWNAALQAGKALDWDYCLIMGSDDFMNEALLRWFFDQARLGTEFAGVTDLWVAEARTGRVAYWPGYGAGTRTEATVGAGRLISRRLVDACNWTLWKPERLNGLDKCVNKALRPHLKEAKKTTLKMLGTDCRLVDLKTGMNMNSYAKLSEVPVRAHRFWGVHYNDELKRGVEML